MQPGTGRCAGQGTECQVAATPPLLGHRRSLGLGRQNRHLSLAQETSPETGSPPGKAPSAPRAPPPAPGGRQLPLPRAPPPSCPFLLLPAPLPPRPAHRPHPPPPSF